ncbi:hypothetical protein NC653_022364 [Populus alba x Populus x berolinensis]|uniref:Uncharacterized protein n=1 Tax=Populus alba x Populus x berolinensis TaxID=444605 RepID=A0AAD6MFX9_9ROSI|nr:hypothetical protein NC653_022364 [Populus alba x Populus x berolinensis]
MALTPETWTSEFHKSEDASKPIYWHLTGDDAWRLVKGAFHNGSFDPQLKPLDLKLIMISQELCAQSLVS